LTEQFLQKLRCPIDNAMLEIVVFESEPCIQNGRHFIRIKNGVLINKNGSYIYPIQNFVPVLLIFETNFHNKFRLKFKSELVLYNEYTWPEKKCEPGEKFIQNSFTDEWNLTQGDQLSFQRDENDLILLNQEVWLKWIKNDKEDIETLLNVGCGIGQETMALQKVTKAKEIVAIDLNFAVLAAGERYKENYDINFVICSLFHPPFIKEGFDLVYSQGVLHHTYSTNKAFVSIAEFVKKGKYLFIWVYGLEDHLCFINEKFKSPGSFVKNLISVFYWYMEAMLRPLLSRAPKIIRDVVIYILSLILHPFVKMRVIHKDLWKLENTQHNLRDTLTPIYAFRHSVNEVFEWYENNNFKVIDFQSPKAHRINFKGKRIHGIGLTGKKLN